MEKNESRFFPAQIDNKVYQNSLKTVNNQVFGNRLYKDQTLYEYVLEFLLVFTSYKTENFEGNNKFHDANIFEDGKLRNGEKLLYFPDPKIGLKRFIFFNNSKNENKFQIDKKANKLALEMMTKQIVDNSSIDELGGKEVGVEIIRDLFYGFSAVLKNRSWFAQSLLPLSPNMIFTESIGVKKEREKYNNFKCRYCINQGECFCVHSVDDNRINYFKGDTTFNSNRHSFFARGGEVYYLHILQGLLKNPEKKDKLESLLNDLISGYPQLDYLAKKIQDDWEDEISACNDDLPTDKLERKKELLLSRNGSEIQFIPVEYEARAKHTVEELINLFELNMETIKKLELFSIGMIIQIFRMMHIRVSNEKAFWVLDISGEKAIKNYAIISYKSLENEIEKALRDELKESKEKIKDLSIYNDLDTIKKSREQSIDLVRKLGKEIGLIIPLKGPGMRMTLTEDLVKFFVLSIVKGKKTMLYTTFLNKLYEKFGIVIGQEEFFDMNKILGREEENVNSSSFLENSRSFEKLLKNTGFLRELSDATSIIENPYEVV